MMRKFFIACFLFTSLVFAQDIRLKYKTLQLSYMTTDRVGGVLKSLGYAVVDFEKRPGVNPNESILTPVGDFADILINGTVSEDNYDALPLIILLPETDNVTLLEMQGAVSEKGAEMGVDLGGSSLVLSTSGEPLQRLLIAYDPDNSEELKEVVSVITNQLDVAAKQIMIEALVVEIDANKTNTLGVNFENSGSLYSSSFPEPDPSTGNFEPFTFIMDKGLIGNALEINAKLEKLISDQSSEILSRPSVLVLDGRQARIVVGQQIPIARSTATGQNVVSATEYIPIGIVLNLRPRISSDGNDITIGGFATQLTTPTTRKMYTHTYTSGAGPVYNASAPTPISMKGEHLDLVNNINSNITSDPTLLSDGTTTVTTVAKAKEIIDWARGGTVDTPSPLVASTPPNYFVADVILQRSG